MRPGPQWAQCSSAHALRSLYSALNSISLQLILPEVGNGTGSRGTGRDGTGRDGPGRAGTGRTRASRGIWRDLAGSVFHVTGLIKCTVRVHLGFILEITVILIFWRTSILEVAMDPGFPARPGPHWLFPGTGWARSSAIVCGPARVDVKILNKLKSKVALGLG